MKEAYIDHSRIIRPSDPLSATTMYEFIPATKIKGLENWVDESKYYDYYKKTLDFPIEIEEETELNFPKNLNVYMYEKCDVTSFPHPEIGKTGVLGLFPKVSTS